MRDLLLERTDCIVELYEGNGAKWQLVNSGTPGKLGSFEEVLFASNEMQVKSGYCPLNSYCLLELRSRYWTVLRGIHVMESNGIFKVSSLKSLLVTLTTICIAGNSSSHGSECSYTRE